MHGVLHDGSQLGRPRNQPPNDHFDPESCFSGLLFGPPRNQPPNDHFDPESCFSGLLFGPPRNQPPNDHFDPESCFSGFNFLGRSGRLGVGFGVVRKATPKSKFLGQSRLLGVGAAEINHNFLDPSGLMRAAVFVFIATFVIGPNMSFADSASVFVLRERITD